MDLVVSELIGSIATQDGMQKLEGEVKKQRVIGCFFKMFVCLFFLVCGEVSLGVSAGYKFWIHNPILPRVLARTNHHGFAI